MPYTSNPLLDEWIGLANENKWLAQFGQSEDSLTNGGATGCTDTVLQTLILGVKGRRVSHNDIRRAAGRGLGSADTGLTPSDCMEVIRHWGLPYRTAFDLKWAELLPFLKRGPVMIAVRYADWPNWAHWGGVTRPTPWARPLDKARRNQFSGFTGAHANLDFGFWCSAGGSGVRERDRRDSAVPGPRACHHA